MSIKLIVGLGNPGTEYQNTRHNIGFMAIDLFNKKHNITLNKNKFNGDYYQGKINDQSVIILKPQTYMNLSGECVQAFVSYFKIDIKNILVIYDDLDTRVGQIRIRSKGSSGGQNGIKNIINHLHTENISRIRIGIDRNKLYDVKDYVLSSFNDNEDNLVLESLNNAANAATDFISTDIERVISKYNQK